MSKIVVQISYSRSVSSAQWTKRKIQIGSVDDVSITTSSTITSHPIVSGDMISDHMFRDPITIKVSGTISIHGDSYSTNFGNLTLAQMQTEFEKIKNSGILCEITKIDTSIGEDTPKFIKRSNMALTSITWTEGIDDMKFDFSFSEVMTAKISVDNVDYTDSYLPNITDLIASNFTEEMFPLNQPTRDIVLALYDAGGITTEFLNDMANAGYAYLLNDIISHSFTSSDISGIDLSLYQYVVKEYTKRKFAGTSTKYTDYKSQGEKFLQGINGVRSELSILNEAISLYRFSNDGEQIAYGDVNGTYYKFKFEKVIVPSQTFKPFGTEITTPEFYSYSMKVYDIQDNLVGHCSRVDTAPSEFLEATKAIFTTSNGRKVYLLFRKPDSYVSYYHSQIEQARARASGQLLSSDNDARVDWCWLASSTIEPSEFSEKVLAILDNMLRR